MAQYVRKDAPSFENTLRGPIEHLRGGSGVGRRGFRADSDLGDLELAQPRGYGQEFQPGTVKPFSLHLGSNLLDR